MSYTEQCQSIVAQYISTGQPWPASAREMANWAIANELWAPDLSLAVKQCAHDLAQAMREEYFTDQQGRDVRAKHAVKVEQTALWVDMRVDGRQYMEISFQQRRNHILGECRQLKTDVDSYNQNINPGVAIQMIFDFRPDLEELASAAA